MTYHIVRMNDTLQSIAKSLELEIDEIKELNKFIKDWNHLIPGTKLRLPKISRALETELELEEPFIEEYYPKLGEYDNQELDNKVIDNSEKSTDVIHSSNHQSMVIPDYSLMDYYPHYRRRNVRR